MTTFMEAWERSAMIDGWLTECEAKLLFDTAMAIPADRRVVEIGAYRGKSTSILGSTGRQVITLDPLSSDHKPENMMNVTDRDQGYLEAVLCRHPNVRWLRIRSDDYVNDRQPVAMLFIDGCHVHPAPLRDFRHFRPYLVPGSYVCFHDYRAFDGVTNAVDYLVGHGELVVHEIANKLIVCRVPDVQKIPVSGFVIWAMCYKFEKRLRLFLKSLYEQQDMSVPIYLNLFIENGIQLPDSMPLDYEKKVDRVYSHVTRSSREQLLRRAELFSLHLDEDDHTLSHTIFTDCDLWFPPQFFNQYAKAIDAEAPGYWSACVKDILPDDADLLVDAWQKVDSDTMERYALPGYRYDHGHGTAGHFQCVPTMMASYPDTKIHGVSQADHQFANWAISESADKRIERRISESCPAYHLGHPYSWEGTDKQL